MVIKQTEELESILRYYHQVINIKTMGNLNTTEIAIEKAMLRDSLITYTLVERGTSVDGKMTRVTEETKMEIHIEHLMVSVMSRMVSDLQFQGVL